MMKLKFRTVFGILLFVSTSTSTVPLSSNAAEMTAQELLRKVDRLFRSDTSESVMTMTIKTPNWTREMKIKGWSQGMKKTFIRVLEPKKDKGVATLRDGREMWNYFPKINKVVKVPPSMMMGSWMGSDFTNDDLVRETSLEEEYEARLERKDGDYLLTITPKANTPTVWGKIEARIDPGTLLPKEQAYYDEKGAKVRVMNFRDVKEFDGRKVPMVMELVPLNKPGHSTTVTYEKLAFDKKLPADVFTLRNLQKEE